jgi:hypothetical protein
MHRPREKRTAVKDKKDRQESHVGREVCSSQARCKVASLPVLCSEVPHKVAEGDPGSIVRGLDACCMCLLPWLREPGGPGQVSENPRLRCLCFILLGTTSRTR